jgi:hypothetical protein
MSAPWSTFHPDQVSDQALRALGAAGRPLTTAEISAVIGEPAHRVVIALDAPLRLGVAHLGATGAWSLHPAANLTRH